jgi:hypothetical protein
MDSTSYPKITFGIIVLNGEPFTRYCLRSIYPYAHEIIVVEGGHEDARSVCTPDGHSIDGTLETLYKFKRDEDPENKLIIVTREGFWPKKDELGRDRTPQSRAYAERATGNYLWQVDIDEFYREEDMRSIIEMLRSDPEITAISFPTYTFWGSIDYVVDSWYLKSGAKYYHRLFKWDPSYKYLTHEPPTVIDETGKDLRLKKWVDGQNMERKKIFMFHYSLLFPWQVEQKVKVYRDEKPENCGEMVEWASKNYFKITNPFRVHNVYSYPGWLVRNKREHPNEAVKMISDIKSGIIDFTLRQTEDIETLLQRWWYPVAVYKYNLEYLFLHNLSKFKKHLKKNIYWLMKKK